MRGVHPPLPHRDREVVHGLNAKPLEAFDCAHDVEHRINGTDFVQMHFLGRDTVHTPLGVAHEPERLHGALFHPVRDRRPLDQLDQLTNVTAVRLLGDCEVDLLTRDSGAAHVANRNAHIADAEPSGQLLEP